MGPGRLNALREAFGFAEAWERVRRGQVLDTPRVLRTLGKDPKKVAEQWSVDARRLEPSRVLAAHVEAGIDVFVHGSSSYPAELADDIEAPAVLFARGDLDALAGLRVAIVGTRRCTRNGRLTALEMGQGIAEAGVRVVSGLALGIDGAAHEGALRSEHDHPVIGVVGTGLDTVYPRRHQALWGAVIERGVMLSEVAMGGGPLPWRFPARNRIIAALADLVVVVESHATGGALHTVDEALRRDRPVGVVPGAVRSPASAGTNELLHTGFDPVRDTTDVLTALGFAQPVVKVPTDPPNPSDDTPIDASERLVLAHLDGTPTSIDALVNTTGMGLGELAVVLITLEQRGAVVRSGSWVERVR